MVSNPTDLISWSLSFPIYTREIVIPPRRSVWLGVCPGSVHYQSPGTVLADTVLLREPTPGEI